MARRTQGDPKIYLDEDGADFDIRGGQPIMSSGLGNAVILSLFTKGDWVGNYLTNTPNEKFTGKFEEALKLSVTVSNLAKIRDAALKDLAWLTGSGVASDIRINVKSPSHNRLDVEIQITAPGGNIEKFQLSKYGENWIAQAKDEEAN